jgi:ABC-type branched-subunit amino acid transport system substrate-binding protein
MYAGMPWYWKLQDKYKRSKLFNQAFQKKTGRLPAAYAQPAYETPWLLAQVVNEVKSLDKEKIRKALEGRKYSILKGQGYIRPCDHAVVQDVYFMKGKAKKDMTNKWDFFTVEQAVGGEDILRSCKDKGL